MQSMHPALYQNIRLCGGRHYFHLSLSWSSLEHQELFLQADATPCSGTDSETDIGPEPLILMQALKDFQDRIAKYEEVYETITDRSLHYIKLIDM